MSRFSVHMKPVGVLTAEMHRCREKINGAGKDLVEQYTLPHEVHIRPCPRYSAPPRGSKTIEHAIHRANVPLNCKVETHSVG